MCLFSARQLEKPCSRAIASWASASLALGFLARSSSSFFLAALRYHSRCGRLARRRAELGRADCASDMADLPSVFARASANLGQKEGYVLTKSQAGKSLHADR